MQIIGKKPKIKNEINAFGKKKMKKNLVAWSFECCVIKKKKYAMPMLMDKPRTSLSNFLQTSECTHRSGLTYCKL